MPCMVPVVMVVHVCVRLCVDVYLYVYEEGNNASSHGACGDGGAHVCALFSIEYQYTIGI